MKVLREPIQKTENEGERIFSAMCLRQCISPHSYKVVYTPVLKGIARILNQTVCNLLQGLYSDQYLLSNIQDFVLSEFMQYSQLSNLDSM